MSDLPQKLVPRKKRTLPAGMGGKQEGAGRPSLPPEQQKVRRVVFLPPDLDGWLTDQVGNGRAAVEHEIIRIVQQHKDTPAIL